MYIRAGLKLGDESFVNLLCNVIKQLDSPCPYQLITHAQLGQQSRIKSISGIVESPSFIIGSRMCL